MSVGFAYGQFNEVVAISKGDIVVMGMDRTRERIDKHMRERGLSQTDLSKLSGVPASSISRILGGRRKAELRVLRKVASALCVGVGYLAGDEEVVGDEIEPDIADFFRGRWYGLSDSERAWLRSTLALLSNREVSEEMSFRFVTYRCTVQEYRMVRGRADEEELSISEFVRRAVVCALERRNGHGKRRVHECPFCGATRELSVEENDTRSNVYKVWNVACGDCGACGPLALLRERAIELWNDRQGEEE